MEFPVSFAPTPEDYIDNDEGCVLSPNLVFADPEGFAEAFCEGSPALKQTLLYLWAHDIHTAGCCIGHEGVHSYEKQTLFGRKEIDKATYLAHSSSARYHDKLIKSEHHAYLALKPATLQEAKKIQSILDAGLSVIEPPISYGSYASGNIITFSLKNYEPPEEREQFFTALYQVISRDLIPQLTGRLAQKTSSLDERISSASERVDITPHTLNQSIQER